VFLPTNEDLEEEEGDLPGGLDCLTKETFVAAARKVAKEYWEAKKSGNDIGQDLWKDVIRPRGDSSKPELPAALYDDVRSACRLAVKLANALDALPPQAYYALGAGAMDSGVTRQCVLADDPLRALREPGSPHTPEAFEPPNRALIRMLRHFWGARRDYREGASTRPTS